MKTQVKPQGKAVRRSLKTLSIFLLAGALLGGAAATFAQDPEAGMDNKALDAQYPFPTDPERDLPERATIPTRYYKSTVKPADADSLSFEILIRKEWKAVQAAGDPKKAAESLVSLRLYRSAPGATPEAEIEIQHTLLSREITAENWLERFVETAGWKVIRGRTKMGPLGPVPDWLVLAEVEGKRFVFRLAAFKDGARLFLVWGRAVEADYPKLAEEFAVAMITFRPLAATGQRYAEELLEFRLPPPARGTIRYPASWVLVEPKDQGAEKIVGTMFKWGAEKELLGLMAVKVFKKTRFPDIKAEDLMRLLREDMKADVKVTLSEPELRQPLQNQRFPGNGLVEIAQGKREGGRDVEFRGAVLENDVSFITLSLVGPSRKSSPDVWTINRRAFEVVLLEMQPE
ncbi:MAG: hypothetical protein HYZ53_15375 [Planctomycetes bacterium]|nr:hypothetical protein [Planctomycetota bacterium]